MRYWLTKDKYDGMISLWVSNTPPVKIQSGVFYGRKKMAAFCDEGDEQLEMHNILWKAIKPVAFSLRKGQCAEIERPRLVLKNIVKYL